MAPDWISKYLPTRDSIRRQNSLAPVRHLLLDPALWRLHQRSVGGAFFIGLFCAFLPLPVGQMLLAGLLAVVARCNVPIAIGLTWVTNPITLGPIFFFAYKLGAWLLGLDPAGEPFELSWQWLRERFAQAWWPLLFGSLVCAWTTGLTGMVVSRQLWRLHLLRRLMARRAARRLRQRLPGATLKRNAARRPGSPASP